MWPAVSVLSAFPFRSILRITAIAVAVPRPTISGKAASPAAPSSMDKRLYIDIPILFHFPFQFESLGAVHSEFFLNFVFLLGVGE